MKKINKKLLFSILMIAVFSFSISNLLFSSTDYASNSTTTIDGFEKENDWTIKFSGLKAPKWEDKTFVFGQSNKDSANKDSAKSDSPSPASETPPANQTPPTNETTSTSASTGDNSKWLKWLDSSSFSAYEQSLVMPRGIDEKDREKEKKILGVKASWIKKAYNWVAVEPTRDLFTPINPVNIALWVWGSYYDYDLSIVVQNSEGYYYTLYLGNLKYYGWKRLGVNIPSYVYPKNGHNFNTRLKIIRLKITTHPGSDIKGFYTYFDYMQVMHKMDTTTSNYSGLSVKRW